mmetsp:Transcript_26681/g.64009  ORF Transcript_26681/g.64009 Transcript_26681/m.64009 type:complete len:206 (-) Transcript_26681:102-719(-)
MGRQPTNPRREYMYLLEIHSKKYPNHRPLLPEEMPRRNCSSDPKEDGIWLLITQERINKLNSLDGFRWDISPKWTSFEQRIAEYKQFQKDHGHGFIPQHCEENPPLGKWVSKMRYEYTLFNRDVKSQLTTEKIRELESIGFEFAGAAGNAKKIATNETLGPGRGNEGWVEVGLEEDEEVDFELEKEAAEAKAMGEMEVVATQATV